MNYSLNDRKSQILPFADTRKEPLSGKVSDGEMRIEPPGPVGISHRAAVSGSMCTLAWEGQAANRSPCPDRRNMDAYCDSRE